MVEAKDLKVGQAFTIPEDDDEIVWVVEEGGGYKGVLERGYSGKMERIIEDFTVSKENWAEGVEIRVVDLERGGLG